MGNLLLLHPACHLWAHRNVTLATEAGWIVSTWGPDPGDVPVTILPRAWPWP